MKKIGIIGGGISGLTLGCVLKGYGKECIIFDDDTSSYTEKAQNIFNNILDDVEVLLGEQGLEQEEI